MEKLIIGLIHKTVKEKWIPIYEGKKRVEPDCILCVRISYCTDCPVWIKYGHTCSLAEKFGYAEWLQQSLKTKFKKHDIKALKVLQNVIRLLPEGEMTGEEKRYLKK